MEPKKKIILYHLGKINHPIANFETNFTEAQLCVDLLNRHVLIENGKPINVASPKVLKGFPFYYLSVENDSKRAFYVGIRGLGNINTDPDFEKKILELVGQLEVPELPEEPQEPEDIDEPPKNPGSGGRKNRMNRMHRRKGL